MKGLETKSFPFEVKGGDAAQDDGGATLEGIVACYLNIDFVGDMYVPGCFKDYLDFFKSEGVIRDEHCVTTGRVDDAAEVPTGLYFKGRILPTTAGKDQAVLVREKAVKRLSLGARNWGRWVADPEEVKAIWKQHGYTPTEDDLIRVGYGVRVIERAKPYEASTTYAPVNDKTAITSIKSGAAPRAGATFDQHSAQVLADLEEFAGRAETLAGLRAETGRGLSAKSLARIGRLQERLKRLAALPEAKAQQATPQDGNALFAQFQATLARMNGVR